MDFREWWRKGTGRDQSGEGLALSPPAASWPRAPSFSVSHLKNESLQAGLITAEGRLVTLEILREVPWAQLGEGLPVMLGANSPTGRRGHAWTSQVQGEAFLKVSATG